MKPHRRPIYKALIIEDDPQYLKMIKKILARKEELNYEAIYEETLESGLEALESRHFDVVLADLGLPDSRGLSTLDEILKTAGNVPVVVLTACDDNETGIEAVRRGAQDYLIKSETQYFLLPRILSYVIERKKAVQKLEEAAQSKSRFTAMVSHELKTPLTVIKEALSYVLDESDGMKHDIREALQMAVNNTDRLWRLISDVLDYQRLDSGKMPFDMKMHDLNQIVQETTHELHSSFEAKKLILDNELAGNIPKSLMDKDRIIQVLMNLLSNAIKFTNQGKVTVKTSMENGQIRLEVSDTGIGIRQEDFPKLFVSFSQIHGKDMVRNPGSTGLGLVITREIIENHAGQIRVESKYQQGSSFIIHLPVVNPAIRKAS